MSQTIIDSNALQSPALRNYLAKSRNNFAVLTDYAAMEAYKTGASIFRSMTILADFPTQTIILKTTGVVCGLRGRQSGLRRRMIDEDQTRDFASYCRNLRAAQHGNLSLQKQLSEYTQAADKQLGRMLTDAVGLPEAVKEISRNFTESELKMIRNILTIPNQTVMAFPPGLIKKIFTNMGNLTRSLYSQHPQPAIVKSRKEMENIFLFRMAVSAFVWALDWISVGGPNNVKAEKMRNDLVDVNFVTFATYFDGLMSSDTKVDRIYRRTSFILNAIRE